MGRQILVLVTVWAVAAGAVALAAADDHDGQAKDQLSQGETLLQSGDLSAAETQLKKVAEQYQTTEWAFWARVRLSECYLRKHRLSDCIVEARKVSNLRDVGAPQLAAAWAQFNVGLAYAEMKDLDSATAEMQKVAEMLGDNPDRGPAIQAKCNLALLCHGRNDRIRAIALADEVLAEPKATDMDRARARVTRGMALIGEKRTEQGLAELDQVRANYPGLDEPLTAADRKILECRYIAKHDYDGAVSESRAIAATPGVSAGRVRQARFYAATALLYKRDADSAIAEAQAVLDNYPEPAADRFRLHVIKARAHALKKDCQQSLSCLQAALDANPPDKESRATIEWDMATCYRVLGDATRMRECYQRLVDQYKDSHLSARAAAELAR